LLRDTSQDTALAAAERIREAFALAAQDVDGRPVCATVSIGVAHCETPALNVTELMAQADQALYFAKERGRNRVELASLEMVVAAGRAGDARTATVIAAMAKQSAA
jgi:diguanylate cyclase (GGDEF)-like protein